MTVAQPSFLALGVPLQLEPLNPTSKAIFIPLYLDLRHYLNATMCVADF